MTAEEQHCPICGYTEEDAKFHMDHSRCKNAGNAPWEKRRQNAAESLPAARCAMCKGKGCCHCQGSGEAVPPAKPEQGHDCQGLHSKDYCGDDKCSWCNPESAREPEEITDTQAFSVAMLDDYVPVAEPKPTPSTPDSDYLVTYTDLVRASSPEEAIQEAVLVILAEDGRNLLISNMTAVQPQPISTEQTLKT
jgi:hypothetical protein